MPDDNEKLIIDYTCGPKAPSSVGETGVKNNGLEMKGEIWMTTNEHSMIGSRIPFTREEKEFLCELIQKHVYSKLNGVPEIHHTTDANGRRTAISAFCRVPNAAWKTIEEEYNAEENVRKRSIKQLRKCWENLKHRGKINPEALYSGKRLQGSTSLTGGFTLSTAAEDEEHHDISAISPRDDQDASPMTSDNNDDSMTGSPPCAFVNMGTTQKQFTPGGFTKYKAINDIAECIIKQDLHRENFRNEEPAQSLPFVAPSIMTSSRPTMVAPRITSVRTVRSLKPMTSPIRRRLPSDHKFSRVNASRAISNMAMAGKTHAQKIHEMKVKLLAARIKEHEANAEKTNLQMQQAQAHHDVTMRLLRTKAAWYDANLRYLEKQLQSGDFSLVGEEETEYQENISDQDEMHYGEEYQ